MTARAGWLQSHDPEARPLGCAGTYGTGGAKAHRRKGEPVCDQCRASEAHYAREYRRGQGSPRRKYGCGTWQAYCQHVRNSEPRDFACRIAYNQYRKQLAAAHPAPAPTIHDEAEALVKRILSKRRRACHNRRLHTPGYCRACGVHSPAGKLKMVA